MHQVLGVDECELHLGTTSRAKKAAAFFRMALSSRRTLFSRRSFLSSSRSEVVRPSASPLSMAACFTQWPRVGSDTPSSRAIWARARPLVLKQANRFFFEFGWVWRSCFSHLAIPLWSMD